MVIVSAFLFYNNDFKVFENHDTKLKNQVSDVITTCIEDSARRGAFLLGSQAGYINLSNPRFKNPFNVIDMGFKIPNWDSSSYGQIPTINSMQIQLHDFILSDANSCISYSLDQLKDHFDINVTGKLSVTTTINPENIVIDANLPIKFNEKNSKESIYIQEYTVNLEHLRLGDLYSLAVNIYNLEARTNFLEKLTLDQIYSASDYSDRTHSMPSEGMDISCTPRYWTINGLKATLCNLNNHNFKYLQLIGTYPKDELFKTSFNDNLSTTKYQDYYNSFYKFELPNPKKSYADYNVDFLMPSTQVTGKTSYLQKYPFREFKVTPSDGQIVTSKKMDIDMSGGKIPIPCIQIYHHLYTLDYDLVVTLTDYNDDGGKFFFRFPLRVVIKNNNPKTYSSAPILGEESLATNQNYCSDNSTISPRYPASVYVKDANTGDWLTGVNISYKCINLKCDLGETKKTIYRGYTIQRSQPSLSAKFPFCSGGNIIASKKGYHTTKYRPKIDPYQLTQDSKKYYEMSLIPTKTFKLNKYVFLGKNKDTGAPKSFYDNSKDDIYVSIENKGLEFNSFGFFPSDEGYFNTLTFLKGDYPYNISIIYVDKDGNLKGLYEDKNVILNPTNGNKIRIKFPFVSGNLDEVSGQEFMAFLEENKKTSQFGIRFIN